MEFDQPIFFLLQIACVSLSMSHAVVYTKFLQDSQRDCKHFEPYFQLEIKEIFNKKPNS